MADEDQRSYLKRLPPEAYQGEACVHWSMTIEDRRVGWLTDLLHARFREILTHTTFRYALACPIYCCMPDHLHLLWIGILDSSDQRDAVKFFRAQLDAVLEATGFRLQKQGHDRVLREEERERSAFENVAEYIARNPERAGLTPPDQFTAYPYTGCLVPGYPDLSPWRSGYWDLFWRLYAKLREQMGSKSPL